MTILDCPMELIASSVIRGLAVALVIIILNCVWSHLVDLAKRKQQQKIIEEAEKKKIKREEFVVEKDHRPVTRSQTMRQKDTTVVTAD